jgi:hypothetical protein
MDVIAPVLERFGGKPTDPEALKLAVAEALAERETTRPVAETAPDAPAAKSSAEPREAR